MSVAVDEAAHVAGPRFEEVASCWGAAGGVVTDGRVVLFSAVDESRILSFDPVTGQTTERRRYTSRTNGLAVGADGTLYAAQSGSRRVLRLNADGTSTLLAERLDGRIHNHPADVSVDDSGRVWFTDPYSDIPAPGAQIFGRLDHCSVLRVARTHRREWALSRMTYDTVAPYGVCVGQGSTVLYVTENDPRPGGRREVRAYPIEPTGSLGPYRVFLSFGEDSTGPHRGPYGMTMDGPDVLVCAGGAAAGPGPMVYRLTQTGRVLATYPVPADPVGCTVLAGDLYVTTTAGQLLRAQGCTQTRRSE